MALAIDAVPTTAVAAASSAQIGATAAAWSATYKPQPGPGAICKTCYGSRVNSYGNGFTYTFTDVQFSRGKVTRFQMNLPKGTTLQAAERDLRKVLPKDARLARTVSGVDCHDSVFTTAQLFSLQTANVMASFETLHWQAQDQSFNPKSVQLVYVAAGAPDVRGC